MSDNKAQIHIKWLESCQILAAVDRVEIAVELRRLAAVEAELERIRALEPVAWGWMKDGVVYDCISPKEHARDRGAYTTPLFALTKDPT